MPLVYQKINELPLASTLNDPEGKFANLIKFYGSLLTQAWSNWIVMATAKTHPHTLESLHNICAKVYTEEPNAISADPVFNSHGQLLINIYRECVEQNSLASLQGVHYIDGDRALAAAIYGEPLLRQFKNATQESLNSAHPNTKLIVAARNNTDFATHPQIQQKTEVHVSRAFGALTGVKNLDAASGSLVLTNGHLQTLALKLMHEPHQDTTTFPHLWWLGEASKTIQGVSQFEAPQNSLAFENWVTLGLEPNPFLSLMRPNYLRNYWLQTHHDLDLKNVNRLNFRDNFTTQGITYALNLAKEYNPTAQEAIETNLHLATLQIAPYLASANIAAAHGHANTLLRR